METSTIKRNSLGQIAKGSKNSFWLGKKLSPEHIEKIKKSNIVSSFWRGKKLPEKIKQKISESKSGKNHWNWKGGITKEEKRIRKTSKYNNWRFSILKRDNYTCVFCLKRGGDLHVDHIKRFSDYPELRFAIDNGRTLCVECHRKTNTYGGKKKSTLSLRMT